MIENAISAIIRVDDIPCHIQVGEIQFLIGNIECYTPIVN